MSSLRELFQCLHVQDLFNTLCVCVCVCVYLSSIELRVMQTHTMVTQPVAMETAAHAYAVCTRPFVLLYLKGTGTRLEYRL